MFNTILIIGCSYLIIGCIFLIVGIYRMNNIESHIAKKGLDENEANEQIKIVKEVLETPGASTGLDAFIGENTAIKISKILIIIIVVFLWPTICLRYIFKKKEVQ